MLGGRDPGFLYWDVGRWLFFGYLHHDRLQKMKKRNKKSCPACEAVMNLLPTFGEAVLKKIETLKSFSIIEVRNIFGSFTTNMDNFDLLLKGPLGGFAMWCSL